MSLLLSVYSCLKVIQLPTGRLNLIHHSLQRPGQIENNLLIESWNFDGKLEILEQHFLFCCFKNWTWAPNGLLESWFARLIHHRYLSVNVCRWLTVEAWPESAAQLSCFVCFPVTVLLSLELYYQKPTRNANWPHTLQPYLLWDCTLVTFSNSCLRLCCTCCSSSWCWCCNNSTDCLEQKECKHLLLTGF